MVPGLTEREARATELRRRDLLMEVERERLLRPLATKRPRTAVDGWRRSLGAALVGFGRSLQGADRATTGPTPAIDPVGIGR